MRTSDYLDLAIKATGVRNDHQLMDKLSWGKSQVNNYRHNRQPMDNKQALKLAELLDIPVWQIIADMEIERAIRNDDAIAVSKWRKLAKSTGIAGMVALGLNVAPMMINPSISTVSAGELNGNNIHYTNVYE